MSWYDISYWWILLRIHSILFHRSLVLDCYSTSSVCTFESHIHTSLNKIRSWTNCTRNPTHRSLKKKTSFEQWSMNFKRRACVYYKAKPKTHLHLFFFFLFGDGEGSIYSSLLFHLHKCVCKVNSLKKSKSGWSYLVVPTFLLNSSIENRMYQDSAKCKIMAVHWCQHLRLSAVFQRLCMALNSTIITASVPQWLKLFAP